MSNLTIHSRERWLGVFQSRNRLRLVLLVVMFLALASVRPKAEACQCTTDYGVPLCAMYWNADFVFVARVKSISGKRNRDGMYPENTRVRLQILEVIRGGIAGEVLDSQGNGADCLVEYQKGRRYLIYAHNYDSITGRIYTSTCSGSREITTGENAHLNALRAFGEQKKESLVSGRVVSNETNKPISGIEVLLQSNGQNYISVTDAEGLYNFALKHEGLVKVNVVIPYEAFDGGYGGIIESSNQPNRTILEYEETVLLGQCRFKEFIVVKLPNP